MKTKRFLFSTLFAVFFFMANANAIDFGKVAKKARQVSADLEQIAKKFEKLQSDKVKVSEDERGVVLTFSAQLFAVGKADLTSEAKENLLEVAKTLAEYPNMDIEIEGHTDSTGSAKLNQDLSEKRAKNVMNFLIEQGIAKERLSAVGYGKDRPIADNGTEAGRSINRRVELVVKERVEQKEEVPKEAKEKDPIRFGIRASGGITGLTGDLGATVDGGYALGAGIFFLIPLDFAALKTLNIGASIMYKKTLSTILTDCDYNYYGTICYDYDAKATEIAAEIPMLLRFSLTEQLYIEAGPQINLAFLPEVEVSRDGVSATADYEGRSSLDFGITAGIGFNITEHISLDARIFYGLNDFEEATKGSLYEVIFGLNYLF
jgi:outer membrane protein OmpA-like peptidoglycan-associated protein